MSFSKKWKEMHENSCLNELIDKIYEEKNPWNDL